MKTQFPTRPPLDGRMQVVLSTEDKRRLFEIAAAKGTTASQLIRNAIARVEGEAQAA